MEPAVSQVLHIARRRILIRWPALQKSLPQSYPRSQTQKARASTIATIAECPKATCSCAEMPAGLDIDHKSPLDGTVAQYDLHVLVRTGRSDWTSRIEDDERLPHVSLLKNLLGRKGKFHDPYRNVVVTTSSGSSVISSDNANFLFFPSFLSTTVNIDESLVPKMESVVQQFILPKSPTPNPKTQGNGRIDADQPMSGIDSQTPSPILQRTQITDPLILICGHGARDDRCGILGPILQGEFERQISHCKSSSTLPVSKLAPSVELISHIGGHKFAGNVIVYFPKSGNGWEEHPLAGMGIWMGRVRPDHVEGIVKQTLLEGRVVKELFRGGIDGEGRTLRLSKEGGDIVVV